MNIIIVGVGKIGSTIAQNLSEEGHDITVIDMDVEAVDKICSSADIMGIVGNGMDYKVLDDAQIREADVFIAMTGSDELNILACVIAGERKRRSQSHELKTIARVSYPIIKKDQRSFIREKLGISKIINPRYELSKEISNFIINPSANEVDYFAKDKVEMLSATLPKNSPLNNKTLEEIFKKSASFLICAIERDGKVIIPSGKDILCAGDKISFVTSSKDAGSFFKRAGLSNDHIKRVIIVGGGDLSYYLAKRLDHFGCKTKIIECNPARCEALDEMLGHRVTVIQGDGTDSELLEEEGIGHCDAFISAMHVDEENIMLSLFVKTNYNVKTITKVNRNTYSSVLSSVDPGTIVYPKNVMSERIASYIKSIENAEGSNLQSIVKIANGNAYALEFHIDKPYDFVGKPLSQLKIRSDALLCCISRKNKFIIPGGNDCMMPDDDVVVVSKDKNINDIRSILM